MGEPRKWCPPAGVLHAFGAYIGPVQGATLRRKGHVMPGTSGLAGYSAPGHVVGAVVGPVGPDSRS